jgi:hypothetical protein
MLAVVRQAGLLNGPLEQGDGLNLGLVLLGMVIGAAIMAWFILSRHPEPKTAEEIEDLRVAAYVAYRSWIEADDGSDAERSAAIGVVRAFSSLSFGLGSAVSLRGPR